MLIYKKNNHHFYTNFYTKIIIPIYGHANAHAYAPRYTLYTMCITHHAYVHMQYMSTYYYY